MSADYAPGTVAIATVKGKAGVRVVRYDTGHEEGWYVPVGLADQWHDREVTDVRPLVVLDVSDPAFLVTALRDALPFEPRDWDEQDVALADLAGSIERQTKPPRIPEPGVWGVVEARLAPYGERLFFVRTAKQGDHDWQVTEDGSLAKWSELIDPTLIRDGVES